MTAEQLAETPYLFIGLEHNKTDFEDASATKENTTLTANGANVSALSSQGWYNSLGKYSTSYVNTKHSDDPMIPLTLWVWKVLPTPSSLPLITRA